ncbi:MAG: ydfG [Burkholderiales bacterium]|jgi:NADP-dependent 3-hydroxy acid dehydrogenase YdfG|nr:ydfG [Burkholderiales bacterium]
MDMIKNKNVLITGASSGIGAATATEFAKLGANLILVARRQDKIEHLASQLKNDYNIRTLSLILDVRSYTDINNILSNLPEEWQNIDILVNNAGLALSVDLMQEANIDNWDTMIDTNLKGLLYITRAVLPNMIKRNSGHIFNIGSAAGHGVYQRGNVYCATKHAVRSISQSLRLDLSGTSIRVTEIDPGAVGDTEFSKVRWNSAEKAKEFYSTFTALGAIDIAEAIIYCATRRLNVNISEMVIYPIAQASLSVIAKNDGGNNDIFSKVSK